jgi:two-component system, cell cycle sensor histidine kinase and response regulator CckA
MPISAALLAGYVPLGIAAVVATVASRFSTRAPSSCPVCGSHEELLATVLERVPDAVLLLDENGVVSYANTAAQSYRISTGADLIESPLIHEEDRAGIRSVWKRLRAMPGQSVSAEVRMRRGDAWCNLVVTAENLLDSPAVGAVLVTATDALRRHELDWRLQQAQRLEAIGRLAGGVAHDFNNYLTTIQGLTELTLEDPSLSPESRTDLHEVAKAAERAANVTRRLLAFSRRQVLRPRQVDLNEQVRDAQKGIGQLTGDDVVVNLFTGARDAKVFVDPTQLEQILLNLALNARDAMPQGGLLTLRTDDVTITPEHAGRFPYAVRPGDYVLLEVSDTGPGIPASLRQQVFEPFFTTKSSHLGSGLGLSTVYGIVKQSGGYVWIDDAEGGGARISVHLPRGGERSPTGDAVARDERPVRGGTVLIAEDDATVRFLARRVLAREGYTVLEAADGAHALEVCASYEGRIDLLLSDVVMPGPDGSQLVERCRAARPDMAVLFMSGHHEDAVIARGVSTGVQDLVEKPFAPDELTRRVRDAIVAHSAG